MDSESQQPGSATVVLDYSRVVVRKRWPGRWLRAFWSHQARLDLARSISFVQGLGILAGISIVAGLLCVTHGFVHPIIQHGLSPHVPFAALKAELAGVASASVREALRFVPMCFCGLVCLLVILSTAWVGLVRRAGHWAKAFPVLSVGSLPLLWFFVLFQLDGLSPFIARPDMWYELWNPVTNIARFCVLMGGIILLTLWIIDAGKLYQGLARNLPGRLSRA